MSDTKQAEDTNATQIMLGLLESVEREGGQSQRRLASELGIALGLVNTYLRRCIKKGLVKARQAPARTYVYSLTPQGFAEKSRLTVQYLSSSFEFFRRAKADCLVLLRSAEARGFGRVVLAGKSDLAEIAAICALDSGVEIVAVVDQAAAGTRFVNVPVVTSFDALDQAFDAVVVTDLLASRETYEAAADRYGADRVLLPELLRLRSIRSPKERS